MRHLHAAFHLFINIHDIKFKGGRIEHTVYLQMAQENEVMVDVGSDTSLVEDISARKLLLPEVKRSVILQAARSAPVVVDMREDPATGTINDDKEITPRCFIGHLLCFTCTSRAIL
jgi:hypothetical protein